MEAELIRQIKGWSVGPFFIKVNNKEIPLVTEPIHSGYSEHHELTGFGFELCACSSEEVQAVFRCYLNHARILEIYYRVRYLISQSHFEDHPLMYAVYDTDELSDLLNWNFLSDREINEVTHIYKKETDDEYPKQIEENRLQKKRAEKERENLEKQNRQTYIYLMRDNATNNIKIGYSKNPTSRESTFFAEKPSISLIDAWRGTKPEERQLHKEFTSKHLRGEWFALTDDDIESIRKRFAAREKWITD